MRGEMLWIKCVILFFSLPGHNYITDYLYHAVFDFRKDIEKNVFPSVHANEYYNGPTRNIKELKVESEKKVKQGIDIIMNLISEPNKCYVEKHNVVQKEPGRQKIKEREYEHERTRK